MADDQPPGSPGKLLNDIEANVRKDFSARLESARAQVREARDKADAEKICSQKANEEMTRRMAEYRRGRWYDVGAVVTSAVTNLDVHDLARTARTFGLAGYHVVTPVESQRAKAEHIAAAWQELAADTGPRGPGGGHDGRASALRIVHAAASVADVIATLTAQHGQARARLQVPLQRAGQPQQPAGLDVDGHAQ